MKTRRWRKGSALAVAAALVLAACGGSDDDGAAAGPAEGGSDGLSPAKVTSIGFCNEIYLWWGLEQGIYEDHGIDLELVPSQGGAAGIAAIMSGAADFSFTNGFTALISLSQGFPIQFVAGAYENAQAPDPGTQGIWVREDSDIDEVADLTGRSIAVNELGGINQIVAEVWLRENGVDPDEVDFVALPLPQIAPSVAGGQVDAGSSPIANIGADLDEDLISLGDPMQEGMGRLEFAGYLASDTFMEENAEVAEAFQAALAESIESMEAPENVDAAFALAGENCGQDPELLQSQAQNPYDATISVEVLEDMADVLVEGGYLQEAPGLDGFVPEFAQG